MTAARNNILMLEVCIKPTTDIIIFNIANCILTPKIKVGRVRPTNNGSDDRSEAISHLYIFISVNLSRKTQYVGIVFH